MGLMPSVCVADPPPPPTVRTFLAVVCHGAEVSGLAESTAASSSPLLQPAAPPMIGQTPPPPLTHGQPRADPVTTEVGTGPSTPASPT